jgi:hypothetical protein
MSDLKIECPKCNHPFELTEALAGPILDAERRKARAEAEQNLGARTEAAVAKALEEARAEAAATVANLEQQKQTAEEEVERARDAKLAALKAKQEAEEAKRNVEVEVARRVGEQTDAIADRLRNEAAKQHALELEAERRHAADARAALAAALGKAQETSDATAAEMKRQLDAHEAELAKARDAELAALNAKQEAESAKRSVEVEVARRVAEGVTAATVRARDEAAARYATELESVHRALAEQGAKLSEAREAEIAARRAIREAEEAKREAELLVERRLDEERGKVREQALKERDDEYRLKVQEKELQLQELKQKLDEAQRKAELGSVQRMGEVLEVDLFDTLSQAFPTDDLVRVKKGQKGGDLIQTVRNTSGVVCGLIKWESKHTQNWSATWLLKLREDQREHKCDIAALMTETLPAEVTHFDLIDGVWVTSITTVVPMATALRRGLMETSMARRAAAGADSTKDRVYTYLTGQEFKARVQGIVEPVIEMRSSLDAEKRAAARQFAARDKQIDRVVTGLSGMYGDLQGTVGPSLPSVTGLALPEHAVVAEANSATSPDANAGAPDDAQVH